MTARTAARSSRLTRSATIAIATAVLVLASACTPGNAASSGEARTIRYLPLGDSITAMQGAYRTVLWQNLVQRDHDRVDFVGSQAGKAPAALGDQDHEGHGGWCIAGPCHEHGEDTVVPAIDGWLRTSRPDIVSIHLGTNDIVLGASGQQTAARLDQLVGLVYAWNPDTVVVLIQIIPIGQHQQAHDDYDALVPGIAVKYQAQGRAISVVDLSHLLTYPQDYRDKYHPTQAGFDTMGQALTPAISAAYRQLT